MRGLIFLIWVCFASCQAVPGFSIGGITSEDAIAIAKKELARRNRPLPPGYVIQVEKGDIVEEPDVRQIYEVSVGVMTNHHFNLRYGVSVNLHNGVIEDIFDERDYRPANMSLEQWRKNREKAQ